jgi:hypothetical protein
MAFWKVWFGGRKWETFNSVTVCADAEREVSRAQAPVSAKVLREILVVMASSDGVKSFFRSFAGCGRLLTV